ncbi:hypothetical protein M413DRAFT_441573 [Hebeloma cylindrosporum]|uniref:Uncharacterized protein n=1 Tax=Hebeloma cylindrosporum TaxID=76867 RepID=A0A0C3CCH3_HEBCY|nr:hypothetical protein M413DRAFT_441573 [Hebeloma cylindrosporum h7]
MSPATTAATATKKRKSDATVTAAGKKAKLAAVAHAETVESILSDVKNFELPDSPTATRKMILELAQYARSLEEEVDATKPKALSPAELAAAAAKLANAVRSGIRKQLTWKPSAKTGSARWTYDGVCPDPEVFGAMLNLGGPPKFKATKMAADEFQNLIGDLDVSIRYDVLRATSDVNIQWKPDQGTFKFSGSYGK